MIFNSRHTHIVSTVMLLATAALPLQPLATNSAYSDTEASIGNMLQAGVWGGGVAPLSSESDIVLNEFLPNPDESANGLNFGKDSDDMPLGEWVELYNKGDSPRDVENWYLVDESGGAGNTIVIAADNTQPATTTIPAHGWLVVYFNKAILNNTGDSIYLYTGNDVLIDSYSYSNPSDFCENEPTPGDANVDTSAVGDCSNTSVAPNKSYARIPDGTGAWVDPIPTPGGPNVVAEDTPANSSQKTDLVVEVSNEPLTVTEPASSTDATSTPKVEVSDEPLEVTEPATSTPDATSTPPVEVSSEPLEVTEPEAPSEEEQNQTNEETTEDTQVSEEGSDTTVEETPDSEGESPVPVGEEQG